MNDRIAEILLEKHFFASIAKQINRHHRPASSGPRRFKKISFHNNAEQWYGFDQGFVYSDDKHVTIEKKIRAAIKPHHNKTIPSLQIAFFFQFKVVKTSQHPNRLLESIEHITPAFKPTFPYFNLDMKKNATTNLSQHETLYQLSKVKNAHVYYALPMVFSRHEIDRTDKPSLDKLKAISLKTAPSSWVKDTTSHYIALRDRRGSDPYWCSEASPGEIFKAMSLFDPESDGYIEPITQESLRKLLVDCVNTLSGRDRSYPDDEDDDLVADIKHWLPSSFCILQFD